VHLHSIADFGTAAAFPLRAAPHAILCISDLFAQGVGHFSLLFFAFQTLIAPLKHFLRLVEISKIT